MAVLSARRRTARLLPALGAAGVVMCLAAGCGSGTTSPGTNVVTTGGTPGWHEVTNKTAGFTVKVRDGWTVDASGALVSLHAGKDAVALVRPVLAASAQTASDCLRSKTTALSVALPNLSITSTKDISASDAIGEIHSSVDVRASVTVTAPDGSIVVTGPGDSEVGSFTVPNELLSMGGYSIGSTYSPGYGVNLIVEPYADGQNFAGNYVEDELSSNCADPKILSENARDDVTSTENQLYSENGLSSAAQAAAGEVTYTCSQNGSQRDGYQFADTVLASTSTGQLWQPEFLWGYTAQPNKAAVAASVLQKMAATFKYDPDWSSRQSNSTMATSHIVEETEQAIAADIAQAYDTHRAAQDAAADNWSKATLGQADVTDPNTGTTWRVESGHNYYRRELDGTIDGSDNAPPPDVNITPLETS